MMDTLNTLSVGRLAETQACEFLQAKGLGLVERNYRVKMGEIDLIMQDSNTIVFIEVRLRNNLLFGSAIESITHPKRQKIIRTAIFYLQQQKWTDKVNCRFDVIGISYTHSKAKFEWIQDAFPGHNF